LAWSDDPALAFWAQQPEAFRADGTREATSSENWEAVRKALALVGPAAIAKRVGLTERNARRWGAGATLPNEPERVAQAVVAVAAEAELLLPEDHALDSEAICAELPGRAAMAQCFVAAMTALLAERRGGIRSLARVMEIDKDTVRQWLALNEGELRPIKKTNAIIARLAKFARSEIRALKHRITTDHGPAGDRQAIVACLSLFYGAEKLIILSPAETLALPAALLLGAPFLETVRTVADSMKRASPKPALGREQGEEQRGSPRDEAILAEAAE
jgi:hypothetical protein